MKRKNLVKNVWGIGLTLLLLFGCSPQATLTPKPVEVTPTPSQVPILGPQPGATFSGPIEISGKASSGAISFKVSEDGASITDVNITLKELKCDGLSLGRVHDYMGGLLISITDGEFSASIPAIGRSQVSESENYNLTTSPFDFPTFSDMGSVGQFEGKFPSAMHASGTINIYVWAIMTDRACELGKFTWEAESP